MSDWIEQLERLTRLHKDGALTDAEFAAQKAKLLESQSTPVDAAERVPVEETYFEEQPSPTRWPLYGGIAAVVAVVLGGAAWFGSGIVPDRDLTKPQASVAATTAPTELANETEAAAPTPIALDGTLAFASPSLCQSGDTLERVYKKLEAGMNLGSGRGLTVALDAFEGGLQVTAKSGKDKDGAQTASAEIRFPAETSWHGLKLSRITTSRYYPPETDGSDSRTLNFLESPAKVRKTLARLGFGAPEAPDFATIDGGEDSCGGSIQIEPRDGGSALVCTWGC